MFFEPPKRNAHDVRRQKVRCAHRAHHIVFLCVPFGGTRSVLGVL
jgi:hypothetical protein